MSYTYNGLGERLRQVSGGANTNYSVDLEYGVSQVLSDETYTYVYGYSRIAQYGVGGVDYFLTDALGSVRQLVDANGNVTLAKGYQPYGEVLNSQGDGATSYGYTGEWTSR